MNTFTHSIEHQCTLAAKAAPLLSRLSSDVKNAALEAMSTALIFRMDSILEANAQDLAQGQKDGLSTALLDRLTLTPSRIQGISDSLLVIRDTEDPIGSVLETWTRPNGLNIRKVRVPLGVIGIIYEARPNVTADAIGLALKTGNAVVLRGSSSSYRSNKAIATVLTAAAVSQGIPEDAFQLLEDTSREGVLTFITQRKTLSLIIPRGGAGLIQHVVDNATVPTIETGIGICHVFVDASAQLDQAQAIALNAKISRPSVCNSCETLLVHQAVADAFLPAMLDALFKAGVDVRGCPRTKAYDTRVNAALDSDFGQEFLDLILAVKVVDSLDEAIEHIARYGSQHSEAIVSTDSTSIQRFTVEVDAAAVLVNASTRFTDGGEFGFGAEMGISTQKLHARGPMGVKELTSYKYIVEGNGQTR